jgi:hypothetical protein
MNFLIESKVNYDQNMLVSASVMDKCVFVWSIRENKGPAESFLLPQSDSAAHESSADTSSQDSASSLFED